MYRLVFTLCNTRIYGVAGISEMTVGVGSDDDFRTPALGAQFSQGCVYPDATWR